MLHNHLQNTRQFIYEYFNTEVNLNQTEINVDQNATTFYMRSTATLQHHLPNINTIYLGIGTLFDTKWQSKSMLARMPQHFAGVQQVAKTSDLPLELLLDTQ